MKTVLALCLFMITLPVIASGGKGLHDAACMTCHASLTSGDPTSLYSRKDRKISSFKQLEKQVKGCAMAAGVDWTDSQRAEVVNYLSNTFYHF